MTGLPERLIGPKRHTDPPAYHESIPGGGRKLGAHPLEEGPDRLDVTCSQLCRKSQHLVGDHLSLGTIQAIEDLSFTWAEGKSRPIERVARCILGRVSTEDIERPDSTLFDVEVPK